LVFAIIKENNLMNQVEYEEIQKAPIWTYLIAVIIVGILIFVMAISTTYAEPIPGYLWWFFIAIIVLMILVVANFSRMKIAITTHELDISYGIFHHRVPRSAIKSVSDINLTFRNTGGIGIRLSSLGFTVYNTRWGQGLQVDRSDGAKSVGFSADNPEQIKNVLGFK